jgi:cytochrome P450
MSATDDERFPSFFDPAVQDDPFETYALLREQCPVHRLPENGMIMVTRYDDARQVLADTATYSNSPAGRTARMSASATAASALMAERGWVRAHTLQRTDPPVHSHYRRLVSRVFSRRNIDVLAPRITEIAHELIDRFIDRGECELISDFALPLPGIVICEQLGLPAADYPRFKRWADAMLAGAQRSMTVEEALEQAEIELEAQHHLAAEFEARRVEPRDDLISLLVNAHRASSADDPSDTSDDEPFTIEELQDLLHQMVTGGFETTTSAITNGMWLLLRHPDQMEKLRADRSLLNNFIDESLRFDSPVAGLWRTTTQPTELAAVELAAGESVMVRYASANRDPAKFDDPDVFDIERPNASEHMAFGFGNHFCVGAWLARTELRIGFTALLDRLDDITLARELDPLPHEFSFFLRPMKELPLRFTAA